MAVVMRIRGLVYSGPVYSCFVNLSPDIAVSELHFGRERSFGIELP